MKHLFIVNPAAGKAGNEGALLEQIAHDPECADITALEGQKDTYYYSSQVMSNFFAWVTMLVMEDDLPRTIAEMTRHNCTTYPAPTLLEYFTLSRTGGLTAVRCCTVRQTSRAVARGDKREAAIRKKDHHAQNQSTGRPLRPGRGVPAGGTAAGGCPGGGKKAGPVRLPGEPA